MKTPLTLAGVTRIFNRFEYGARLRPVRDWFALLIISGVLVLASIGFNAWFFFYVAGETVESTRVIQKTGPVPADAGSVTALFERRSQEESRYVTQYRFIDPSRSGS